MKPPIDLYFFSNLKLWVVSKIKEGSNEEETNLVKYYPIYFGDLLRKEENGWNKVKRKKKKKG